MTAHSPTIRSPLSSRLSRAATAILVTIVLSAQAQTATDSRQVVSQFFESLQSGDILSLSSLHFIIPEIANDEAAWLRLLTMSADRVKQEQLAWEVVCGREMTEMAAVIVNQTMRRGQPHGDPDAVYLVKADDTWRVLPDTLATNAKRLVRQGMSDTQLAELRQLERWAVQAIRGPSDDCER